MNQNVRLPNSSITNVLGSGTVATCTIPLPEKKVSLILLAPELVWPQVPAAWRTLLKYRAAIVSAAPPKFKFITAPVAIYNADASDR